MGGLIDRGHSSSEGRPDWLCELRQLPGAKPFLLTRFIHWRHRVGVNDRVTPPAGSDTIDAQLVYSKFETTMQVRPDDIDMYQHVHSSRYMDYVLAARFDQMERCYKMPMSEFQKLGYGWFMATAQMNFKRPLGLGDRFVVRTWIEKFSLIGVKVQFQIEQLPGQRLCGDGWFDYVLVSIETGRPARLPAEIRAKYSI